MSSPRFRAAGQPTWSEETRSRPASPRHGAQRWVDLRLAAEPGQLGLVEEQIVGAALGADVDAVGARGGDELDAARRRDVADVQSHAGGARELEAAGDRLVLGDGGARARVRERIPAMAGRSLGVDSGAHDLVVLGVHAGHAPGGRNRGEGGEQLAVGDPRETLRVGLEGRELERRGARLHELRHVLDRPAWGTVAQTRLDVRLAPDVGDLRGERLRRLHRALGVVGHVDDRRDASGRGGAGAAPRFPPRGRSACGRGRRPRRGAGAPRRSPGHPSPPSSSTASMRPSRIVRAARRPARSGREHTPPYLLDR